MQFFWRIKYLRKNTERGVGIMGEEVKMAKEMQEGYPKNPTEKAAVKFIEGMVDILFKSRGSFIGPIQVMPWLQAAMRVCYFLHFLQWKK